MVSQTGMGTILMLPGDVEAWCRLRGVEPDEDFFDLLLVLYRAFLKHESDRRKAKEAGKKK